MFFFRPIPILFSIGNLKIFTWGLFFVVAFLVSFFLAKRASREKIEEKHFLSISFLILLGVLIGTRLLYVFLHFSYYAENPLQIFDFSEGGSASYGGFIALLFVWLYTKKNKLDFTLVLDVLTPYVVLALAIGRIGCFLNWCCYGKPTNLPWAVQVPGDVPRHPTQLYLFFVNLFLFFVILAIQKKQNLGEKKGKIFLFFLLFYSLSRFFIDFLRDFHEEYFFGLASSQWFALSSIFLSLFFLKKLK